MHMCSSLLSTRYSSVQPDGHLPEEWMLLDFPKKKPLLLKHWTSVKRQIRGLPAKEFGSIGLFSKQICKFRILKAPLFGSICHGFARQQSQWLLAIHRIVLANIFNLFCCSPSVLYVNFNLSNILSDHFGHARWREVVDYAYRLHEMHTVESILLDPYCRIP